MVQTGPLLEADGAVGGGLEGIQGGEVDLHDAQGYGIAGFIPLAGIQIFVFF